MDKAISDLDSVTGIQGSILNYESNFEDKGEITFLLAK